MNIKLFYNVDKNLSETFKNDPITKNILGIVNADEGESFGYIISYNSQITPSYNDIKDIVLNSVQHIQSIINENEKVTSSALNDLNNKISTVDSKLLAMYQELLGMINNLQGQLPTVATLDKSVLDNTKLA